MDSETVESIGELLSFGKSEAAPVVVTPKPEVKPEAKPETKPEEAAKPAEKPRDESGKFTKAEEKPEKPALKPADVAAIIDERKKRQALEQELAELKQKPKTDFYEDPDKAIQERLSEQMQPLQAKYFKLSMKSAQKAYSDFEEAANAFLQASDTDPRLTQQLREHDDPGEFVYAVGTQIRELSDVGGDIGKYKAKILGESNAKLAEKDARIAALETELKAMKESGSQLANVPVSLNTSGSGGTPKQTDTADEPISSLVRFGKTG